MVTAECRRQWKGYSRSNPARFCHSRHANCTRRFGTHRLLCGETGINHYSFAFTYDCIAWSRDRGRPCVIAVSTQDDTFYCPILHDRF